MRLLLEASVNIDVKKINCKSDTSLITCYFLKSFFKLLIGGSIYKSDLSTIVLDKTSFASLSNRISSKNCVN